MPPKREVSERSTQMIDVSGTYIEFLSSVKSVYRVYQNIKPFSRGEKQEKTAIKQEKTAETQDVVLPHEITTTNCGKIVLKNYFIIIFHYCLYVNKFCRRT